MRVAREDIERGLEVLIQQGVVADFAVKVAELFLVWQMTLDQQIGNLVKGSVFRQVRDIVTAVAQDALFTVNEGDLGLGGTGGGITRVEGNEPGLVTELGNVKAGVALGGLLDVHLVLAAWVLEHYLVVFRSHGSSFLYVKSHY